MNTEILMIYAEDVVNNSLTEIEAQELRKNLTDEEHEYLWLKVEEMFNAR